jgi:hypothetical protein
LHKPEGEKVEFAEVNPDLRTIKIRERRRNKYF